MGTQAPGFGTRSLLKVSSAYIAFLCPTCDRNSRVLNPGGQWAIETERTGLCKGEGTTTMQTTTAL